ncbi:MAG TPA: energy transducer TonB [Chitinophagaceae bacterium]|nr:energy transducer TonB [Chitinophagaceae bacterium]
MKVIKLSLKKPVIIALLGVGIVFYSCKDKKDSGENSTKSETDTTIMNRDTIVTGTGGQTVIKKTGKVSVAAAPVNKTDKMAADKSGYYNYTDVAPLYVGGQGAIESYITNNLQYPQEAIDNNIEGTVQVQFGIDENGKITDVTTLGTKLGYGLEEEAIKVVSNMPKWNPGKVKDKNVKTRMILPITYRLEG